MLIESLLDAQAAVGSPFPQHYHKPCVDVLSGAVVPAAVGLVAPDADRVAAPQAAFAAPGSAAADFGW